MKTIALAATVSLLSLVTVDAAMAQVSTDGTLSTTVNSSGNDFVIENGDRTGNNLFHSFREFSVPTGGSAHFNNAVDVQNIFSRVTGGNLSNIDGLIRANGTANLFLLNPSGILFGPNASLNIGGSFVGTTANSIRFANNVEFSAVNPTGTSLLTISSPIGLQMGQNPGTITVQGAGHQLRSTTVELGSINRSANTGGLRVPSGQTLALVGGNIALQGGMLIAEGGRVDLASVQAPGILNLNATPTGFALSNASATPLGTIQLSQRSLVDVSGAPAGAIQVQGRQVSLNNASLLLAQNQGTQAGGRIDVQATESLTLDGYLASQTIRSGLLIETMGSGAGQDTTVTTPQLMVRNGASIVNRTFGSGQGGNITVQASESVVVRDLHPASFSAISSSTLADGNGGNVTVSTPQLTVANGAAIGSVTYSRTQGQGGDLFINADNIEVIGNNLPSSTALSTASFVSGNAGDALINTRRLTVRDSGVVTSSSSSSGTAGNITINASESVTVQGRVAGASGPSQIRSAVNAPRQFSQTFFRIPAVPVGRGGSVTINTPTLTIADEASVTVRNQGIGDAGNIFLNVQSLDLNNKGGITATTQSGTGGNVTVRADQWLMRQGSTITTSAGGAGNGGDINLQVDNRLRLQENSSISSSAAGQGNGGRVRIAADRLDLLSNSQIVIAQLG